jgi:hypothetical protein
VRRDLDHVLTAVGARRREAGREDVVDRLAAARMRETRPERGARRIGVERMEAAGGESERTGAR